MKTTAALLAAVLAFSATSFAAPSPAGGNDQLNEAMERIEMSFCRNGFAAIDQEACQIQCGGMPFRAQQSSSGGAGLMAKRTGGPGPAASGRPSGTCAQAAGFTHPPLTVEAKWNKDNIKTGGDGSITISHPVTTIPAGPYFTCGGCPAPTAWAETRSAHHSSGAAGPSRRA